MTYLLTLLLALQAGQEPIDRLIERLKDESIEARAQAEVSLINRARSWSEDDLAKLTEALKDKDGERASRARNALKWINRFREIPDALWKGYPDLAQRLTSPEGTAIGEILDPYSHERKSFPAKTLIPLLIGLLDDERDSGVMDYQSSGPDFTLTVKRLAGERLGAFVARFRKTPTRSEAETWWKENQAKSEREWHLADLSSEDEWVRACAGHMLAKLKDETAIKQLREVIKGLPSSTSAAHVIDGFASYPATVRDSTLSEHLNDGRYAVRWAAARALVDIRPKEAVAAMVDAHENPSRLTEGPLGSWNYPGYFEWLTKAKTPEAREALYRGTRQGLATSRVAALLALESVHWADCEEVLVEATADPITAWSWDWGFMESHIHAPRACDAAAIVLARRLDIDAIWQDSIRERNQLIELIVNRWRSIRKLESIEYHGPGVAPVPTDRVRRLVAELTSDSLQIRQSGERTLSELGPGAWSRLYAEVEFLDAPARKRLAESQARAANALRSVQSEGPGIEEIAKPLRERLHQSMSAEDLVKLIGEAWWKIPRRGKLECEIIRGAEGAGISIRLALGPPDNSARKPNGFDFDYEHGSSWSSIDGGNAFPAAFRVHLKPVLEVLDQPDRQARASSTVTLTYPENR